MSMQMRAFLFCYPKSLISVQGKFMEELSYQKWRHGKSEWKRAPLCIATISKVNIHYVQNPS